MNPNTYRDESHKSSSQEITSHSTTVRFHHCLKESCRTLIIKYVRYANSFKLGKLLLRFNKDSKEILKTKIKTLSTRPVQSTFQDSLTTVDKIGIIRIASCKQNVVHGHYKVSQMFTNLGFYLAK